MFTAAQRLHAIQQQIANHEQTYAREPNSVRLLAASKGQSAAKIRALYEAGQRIFGENYLQEAQAKMAILQDLDIEWHFIGPIQSNKTNKIAEHFDWVQSVSDVRIAERLSAQRPDHLSPLNVCLEVNISQEHSKFGASIDEIAALAQVVSQLPHLKLRGLMAIPKPASSFATQRIQFHQLHQLFLHTKQFFVLDTLSIGMSGDFEAAIAEGSTLVRIGTALFGTRV